MGKILVVLTSTKKIEGTDMEIGWYLPEFADPFWLLAPKYELVVASPKGGATQVDPNSIQMFAKDLKQDSSVKFLSEKSAVWENTAVLSSFLGRASEFDAIFYPGGHGPMFDIASDSTSQQIIREFWEAGKPVAADCAGVSALSGVVLSNGEHLLAGKAVTGLSKAELAQLPGYTEVMPFLLEDKLNEVSGGNYVKAAEPWSSKVSVVGKLITGQNPASAEGVGKALLEVLA